MINALQRIKIPELMIKIIHGLINNRSNRAITDMGLTESYEVEKGIDQGDSLSPLLWCIFYDPLLREIEEQVKGYECKVEWITDITKETKHEHKCNVSALAYMDDTLWIAKNRKDMNRIIQIVHSFLELTGIQVNPTKSELIVINGKEEDKAKGINLAGEVVIPKKKNEPIHNQPGHITESRILTNGLSFRQQSRKKLNSRLKKLFKHKCRLSGTTMDSVIHSQMGYSVFDILDRQIQMHAREISHRINRQDLVGDTTRIRLQHLQNIMWDTETIYEKSVINSFGKKHLKENLSAKILSILEGKGITFKKSAMEEIPCAPGGGINNLKQFMEEESWYKRNREKLRHRGVMFLEQLLNADLTQSITWQQIRGRPAKGVQPEWYAEVIKNFNKKKSNLYPPQAINPFNTLQEIHSNTAKRFQMVVTKAETELIYGTISRIPKKKESSSLVIQHYVQELIEGEKRSPLIPCEGCTFRNTTPIKDKRIIAKNEQTKCLIRTDLDQSRTIPFRPRIGSTTHKEDRAIKRRLLISPKSINVYYNTPSSLNSVEGIKNNSIHEMHKNILRKEPSLEKYINELQTKISHCRQISFYTDGSLINKKEQDHQLVPGESRMGIGIVISPEGHDEGILDFSARVTGPASSTRAELWAILMVLEITPPNKKIKIYTDSASAIAAIKRFMTDRADNLAKIGAKGNLLVEINPEFLQRKVNYEWKSQSFDTDIKEFAKREQQINWYINWRTQYRVVKWNNKNIARETDWNLTRKLIHGTKISSRVTSNEDRDNRTFNIKILNDELPVLRNLHIRKPEIYKSDLCIICKQKKEDTLHPFECKDYNAIIRRKVIQHLAILGINHGSSKTKKDIVTTFQKERFLKIDEGRQIRGTIESDHFSFIDMIRGLTYKYMKNKIKTAIISDSEKVNKIQEQLFNFLRNVMKLKWAERCNVILKWEKENEISGTDKKEKTKQKKANNNIVNNHYKTIKETLIKGASSIKDTIISESYRVATPFINKFFNINNTRETDWNLTRKLIHGTKISSRVTSNEDRDNRTFNIKILNDELPVLRNLHIRKPEIYKSDLCIICKQKKEDTLHPFECKDYNAIIRRKVIQHLAILGINHGSSKTKKDIVTTFQKERFLKIDEGRQIRGTIESDHFSFIDMIRGLTYKYMKNKIKTAIISDSEKVNKIQEQLFNFLRNVMKLKWAERCNVILKWEKENEISGTDKKEKTKQKKANNNIVNNHYKTIKETLIKGASSIKDTIISESYRVATPFINKFFNINNSGVVTY
ncbi:hypothetical protein Glove_401g2 [Diversispora epigaea]|uniref:Reverse transcriptase domain-containing protein n=1 Tax=Diversispora epigaea TaxID=1348612 RepID=A0A397H4D7_9GLOM|nr:hypothetical protein Glove_401g2 [Diversispora epigaea]